MTEPMFKKSAVAVRERLPPGANDDPTVSELFLAAWTEFACGSPLPENRLALSPKPALSLFKFLLI